VLTLARLAEILTNSLSAAERVFDVIDTQPEIRDAPDAVHLSSLRGHIEFRDVSFGYGAGYPAVKSINFTVGACETVGLVGRSGSGKSTIISLLCRLYDPNLGSILIDGTDIRGIRHADLRRHIGVVMQETFLFNGTIYDNIAYARPEARKEQVIEAATLANAHEFIMAKSDGYDTEVGERGGRLSGGERQRIAIARAILRDPAILILDEATASVDTQTESKIQAALDLLKKNRTTIAIAHRLSTLRNFDRLLVLDGGELAEQGTHQELMRREGIFFKLVTLQNQLSHGDGVAREAA
jgi:ATP-binding cassette subfamily B protein